MKIRQQYKKKNQLGCPLYHSNTISRLLGQFSIMIHFMHDKPGKGIKVAGVCSISRECGKVYVGKTGQSIKTRSKQYSR
jgi:hypothetical protein